MKFPARWIVHTLLLASLAGPAAALAQPVGEVPPAPGLMPGGKLRLDGPRPPILHGVSLTEAQQDKVFDILHAQAPALHTQAKVLRKAQEEVRQLVTANDYSEAKARALAEVAAKAMAEIGLLLAWSDRQFYQMLTPEQRMQAAAAYQPTSGLPPPERQPRFWRE